ncbi:phosphoglycolate phosphatase [Cellvibrio zantedeschiae]|uniref:Phosphoglycolate phosphatase n=1 Tax=Cellvibrio zantedeschiae TaxID=1237077 RepID=A0ABQ3AZX3_9GAMM|nr:HAD-IA family hydrolase [Cellvibrio zantedeschiae]GGY73128.1 phosphoglycolate phosphatase [Cellvibrio zantedeschiae]
MQNQKKIRAVMFDLDGTLLDTAPDFVAVVNKLLQENGRDELPHEMIRACVSNGSKALVMMAFAIEEAHETFQPLRARLLELYTQHIAVFTKPFPGVQDLLNNLAKHNIPWGIATNKPAAYTVPLMEQLNMQPAPAIVICPDHVQDSKPHPESLFLAARELGCTPEEIIYVGDHERDIQCGKRAGSLTIAAAFGYVGNEDIDSWQADYRVEHAEEIWPIVEKYL